MSYSTHLEDMVGEMGGCGRFQWVTAIVVQASKTLAAWSMLHMTFNGQAPNFRCSPDPSNFSSNGSDRVFDNVCTLANSTTTCPSFAFEDDMHTIVNEWDLNCDSAWIVAMITTIQMSGVLVGSFISGHLGDMIGRKPTFFLSLLLLVVVNVVAYFSVNWQMYAAVRFALGLGMGFYLTLQVNVMTEMVPIVWRARAVAFPAWAFEASIFALVAWLFKDWKNIHLATAVIGAPFLLTYFITEESVRFYMTKGRYKEADRVIGQISKMNGRPKPDTEKMFAQARLQVQDSHAPKAGYSVLDLFKEWERAKITLVLFFTWMTISYSYYGLTFGVSSLSGDLYVNMFLMNIIETPASFSLMYIVNRYGRKPVVILMFACTAACGFVVGIIQYVDTPHRGVITNVFALACKMGIAVGWGGLMVYTTELYPTVVRSISYGLCNTAARVGGMVAPQVVFLNDTVPGLMYFLSGGLLTASSLMLLSFPDTNGKALMDTFKTADVTLENQGGTVIVATPDGKGVIVPGMGVVGVKHEGFDNGTAGAPSPDDEREEPADTRNIDDNKQDNFDVMRM
ncbi:organic cation/carnitine transporter 2-like [Mya arenaria]|uniref:organic cation/carnitine transporter 2-like n=1 Tax=Mya arenaria TaxID=6604 RepID=UPI0022E0F793|nr:organic cation/carnitine transporter 2-like [Mya arenaria]